MRCLLLYYTGTFNTRYISNLLKARLVNEGYEVDLYEIDPLKDEKLDFSPYSLVGLGYPIYGFNAPWAFYHFIKKQKFPKGLKTFIYKNSGETYHANDASSMYVVRKIRHDKAFVTNEYHFMMPYNIHFRFDEPLVKEMLVMNSLLLDILVKELREGIANIKKYRFIDRFVTWAVRIQYIGGDVNSFFYKVERDKCIDCGLCIKDCPTKNIYKNRKGEIDFHHHCLMCMRCSLRCPKDAIRIGFLEGWRVNGPYNWNAIEKIELKEPIITDKTEGFFKCYIETYDTIRNRHKELFGE